MLFCYPFYYMFLVIKQDIISGKYKVYQGLVIRFIPIKSSRLRIPQCCAII